MKLEVIKVYKEFRFYNIEFRVDLRNKCRFVGLFWIDEKYIFFLYKDIFVFY